MSLETKMLPPAAKPHASVVRIPDAWYVVAIASELKRKPIPVMVLGVPLVLFRTHSGKPGALLDRCPHRNVPLSVGKVNGEHLVCGYHGWAFDTGGACQDVPGHCGPIDSTTRSRRVWSFPCVEQDGFIWVWASHEIAPRGLPFRLQARSGYTEVRRRVRAPGTLHATIENALDVPHTAFLHGGLFRTAKKTNRIEAVVKRYADRVECEYIGEPRPTGLAARLLAPSGGVVEHFDRFFMPSIAQVEYRLGPDTHILVTSACTPVGDFDTQMFVLIQFKMPLPGALIRTILEPIGMRIFAQDAAMLDLQTKTIQNFGGEQFESTELDLLGPHIWRLMRDAERNQGQGLAEDTDLNAVHYEKRIHLMT